MIFDFEKYGTVETLDVVPEVVRPLYAAKDGKFVLVEALAPFVNAYVGESKALDKTRLDLKKANDESASRRVTQKGVIEFLKGKGVETVDENDPLASLESFATNLLDASKKGKEITVNLDKIKGESERRIAEVVAAKDGEVAKMKGTLEKYLVRQAATAALAKAGGNIDLLLDRVEKSARVVAEGDDYVVRIVDKDGEVRSNGAGGYMDFDGYVGEMKTQPAFAVAFKSEAKAGTGHQPGAGQQRQVQQQQGEKTPAQKIKDGLAKIGNRG